MKKHNKQGFTLAELLIVVAIIAVLVAIAIPVFTTQLEKARVAVDQSTVRSAKAAAVAQYLTDGAVDTQTYYYTGSGVIVDETKKDSITGYGKSTNTKDTGATGIPKDNYLRIEVNSDGTINAYWEGGNDSGNENPSTVNQLAQKFVEYRTGESSKTIDEWLKDINNQNKGYRNIKKGESIAIDGVVYISLSGSTTVTGSTDSAVADELMKLAKSSDDLVAITNSSEILTSEQVKTSDVISKKTVVYDGLGYKGIPKYYIALQDTTSKNFEDKDNWASVH